MSGNLSTTFWLIMLCALGVVPAVIFYKRHCKKTPRGQNRLPLSLYVVALLICAFVAYSSGTGWGVRIACSGPSSGNLCGLLGFIVIGPLSSIIAVSALSWLITDFPLQMKRLVPAGVLLFLLAGGYYFRGFFFDLVDHQNLYQYTLQSGNPDELHRFAPVIVAQMRQLTALKDVSLVSQTNGDPAVDNTGEPVTVTILFGLPPNVALSDALAQIHDMEIQLALPATITTSMAKAPGRPTYPSPIAGGAH
jgi:hypothetical protein